jgi:hypothetical protein
MPTRTNSRVNFNLVLYLSIIHCLEQSVGIQSRAGADVVSQGWLHQNLLRASDRNKAPHKINRRTVRFYSNDAVTTTHLIWTTNTLVALCATVRKILLLAFNAKCDNGTVLFIYLITAVAAALSGPAAAKSVDKKSSFVAFVVIQLATRPRVAPLRVRNARGPLYYVTVR